jgi:hypothetical protein
MVTRAMSDPRSIVPVQVADKIVRPGVPRDVLQSIIPAASAKNIRVTKLAIMASAIVMCLHMATSPSALAQEAQDMEGG